MAQPGTRWTVQDRYGNKVYLTRERWAHIIDANNHPEMADFEERLMTAIKVGRRAQEPLNPRKYRYSHPFNDLPDGSTHIVAIVVVGVKVDDQDVIHSNHWVATAFLKHMRLKG